MYRRERFAELFEEGDPAPPEGEVQNAILTHLAERGACFLSEIERVVIDSTNCDRRDFESGLWDLVWSGLVTNDTFQPLRSQSRSRARTRRGAIQSTLAGGRWSLVSSLIDRDVSATEKTLARAQSLLERYGVVSREAAIADEVPGGWGPIYRVLRTLEESGRVRRGYFVEGLSGAQFASPGAADRLRAERLDPDDPHDVNVLSLASNDPANPWGSLQSWPDRPNTSQAPRRVRSSRVVLADGAPVLFAAPGGRKLTTFGESIALEPALALLAEHPRALGRRWLLVESIDGISVHESEHIPALKRSGYVREVKGFAADSHAVRRMKELRKASE